MHGHISQYPCKLSLMALLNSFDALFLLLSLQASLLISASLFENADASSLIDQVCDHHTNPKFCHDQLTSDPGANKADLPSLAGISIRLAKSRATNTDHIKALLGNEKDNKAKKCLTDCLDDYGEAAASLDSASSDFRAKDYLKMNLDASSASDYGGDCEDGFGESNLKSPLTDDNQAFQNLAQIVEIVANMLAGRV